VAALDEDIAWVAAGAGGLSEVIETIPPVSEAGLEYSALLTEQAASDQVNSFATFLPSFCVLELFC